MPFCMHCGSKVDNVQVFCIRCGTSTGNPPQTLTAARAFENSTASIDENGSVFSDDAVQPQILKIVRNASKTVVFVTPYVDLWGHLRIAIDEAIGRGVSVRFIVRAGEKKQLAQLKWLREHKVKVDEVDRLHAKIYFNETRVLISSMNITDSSTTNSREIAMIVRSEDDANEFRDYARRLTGSIDVPQPSGVYQQEAKLAGFCIRDGSRIAFNASRPLCDTCYPKWAKYQKRTYEEKYCHSCGKSKETTFARPLCLSCYRKLH